jgi:hypothetical protein
MNQTPRVPIPVSSLDLAFGGAVNDILPPWDIIPDEFKSGRGIWPKWQSEWFFNGLKSLPTPKEGIDVDLAMKNLACVQRSFAPKHEHKQAGVAYLASLWFETPEGTPV